MPLKLTCPRCKKALTLPRKTAGSYTKCAHCSGRIWVPEIPVSDGGGAAGAPSSPTPPTPPTSPAPPSPTPPTPAAPAPTPPPATPGTTAAAPAPTAPSGVPPPPAAPQPPRTPAPGTSPPAPWTAAGQAHAQAPSAGVTATGRKARFITSGTTESRLQPAADGKLPSLKLEQDEPEAKSKEKPEGSGIHPMVLFCVLCLGVLASITMVLVDVEGPQTRRGDERARARWTIEREYFSHLDPNEPLVEYQLLLREAQRAHVRGDRQAEREAYHRVLRLLRAERDRFEGLTGSPKSDRDLEGHITVILQE